MRGTLPHPDAEPTDTASTDELVVERSAAGVRTARLRAERRRRRRRAVLAAVAAAVTVWLVVEVAVPFVRRDRPAGDSAAPGAAPAPPPAPEQDVVLLVRHGVQDGPASSVTLLAAGPGDARGVIAFLPAGTLVDIPGTGLDRLGLAWQYGGPALVEAATANLLGVTLDGVAAVSDSGLAALLDRVGGLEVEVGDRLVRRLPDGTAEVRFEPGRQVLDGRRLAELASFTGAGEDELAAFPRQQLVLTALLDRLVADPAALDALTADGMPQVGGNVDPSRLRTLLGGLAEAHRNERLVTSLLPVEPFGGAAADGAPTYRPREDAVAALVTDLLAESVSAGAEGEPLRVQVLNGVGTPGVGAEVERRLRGAGVRIVRTDNARDFGFTTTQILVYDEEPATLAAAQTVRERLGVGTIAVSRQPQSVVDLTIVVGADLLQAAAPSVAPQ